MASSTQHNRTKFFALLIIWAVVTLATALVIRFELLREIEYTSWDWRLRSVARPEEADPRVKIIMIDQSSLEYFARDKIYWPWPRSLYNPLLHFLKESGAKGVAFDLLLTENQIVEDDQEFAAAVESALPVISALTVRQSGTDNDDRVAEKQRLRKKMRSLPPYEDSFFSGLKIPHYQYAAVPFPELLNASAGLGNVQAFPDEDEIYRRVLPGVYLDDIPVPNLAFALFDRMFPGDSTPNEIKPLADDGSRYIVKFHGPAGTYKGYGISAIITSGVQLMNGEPPLVPLSEFKDSYVFIGSNAPGILDLRPVPFSGTYPGVEVHATVFDNLMHKEFFRMVPSSLCILAAAILIGAVGRIAMFAIRLQAPLLVGAYLGWVLVAFGLAEMGWWIVLVAPLFGMLLATLFCLAFQYQFEGRQHRFIKNAFQYYVTPEVIDKIVADPAMLSLGGERRELTIFFSDIAGFTTLSEQMEPSKLVQFLNKFLSEMTDIVLASGGTIDKYEGDAIIAFWNAPLSVPDHRLRAVKASLDCQRKLHDLADHFEKEYGVKVKMRVGLNTGVVTVGNFGSSTRFNYTMIGDAANLASRLEGANKVFGSRILVSDQTRKEVDDGIVWRKLGEIRVVGKEKVVPVYEPLDDLTQGTLVNDLAKYNQAIEAFERLEFDQADALFAQMSADPVCNAYRARIAKFKVSGGSDTHVWNLTEK